MSELAELQDHLKFLKKQVELKESVEFLMNNRQFNDVIIQGFCNDELKRTLGMAVKEGQTPEMRALYEQLAKSSAALTNYLNTTIQLGRTAEEDATEVDAQIQYLLAHNEGEE